MEDIPPVELVPVPPMLVAPLEALALVLFAADELEAELDELTAELDELDVVLDGPELVLIKPAVVLLAVMPPLVPSSPGEGSPLSVPHAATQMLKMERVPTPMVSAE